jgi:hypothetical protein
MCVPRTRSLSSTSRPAASTGKTTRIRIEVTRMFQVKIGMRNMVMPGARIVTMVVMKFTAPRIELRPSRYRPTSHRSPPAPGELIASDSGT